MFRNCSETGDYLELSIPGVVFDDSYAYGMSDDVELRKILEMEDNTGLMLYHDGFITARDGSGFYHMALGDIGDDLDIIIHGP